MGRRTDFEGGAASAEVFGLGSWPVQERYGIVFCWNDPKGLEPDFDIPDIPEWNDPDYMRWAAVDHLADLPCHPIEVFDNNSDWAHLAYLHGGGARMRENEVDGVVYRQRQKSPPRQTPRGCRQPLIDSRENIHDERPNPIDTPNNSVDIRTLGMASGSDGLGTADAWLAKYFDPDDIRALDRQLFS